MWSGSQGYGKEKRHPSQPGPRAHRSLTYEGEPKVPRLCPPAPAPSGLGFLIQEIIQEEAGDSCTWSFLAL